MTDKLKKKIKNNIMGYILILPFLVGLIFFTIYPLFLALFESLFKDYNPLFKFDWSTFGLDNYILAFTDEGIRHSMLLTLVYTALNIPISLSISFILAYLLSFSLKGNKAFRILVYLPAIIPGIVGAGIHKYIFSNNDYGLLNTIIQSFGKEPRGFLESKSQVEALISFMATGFFGFGCSSPMWIAGFRSVPKEIYEAAELDGSSRFKTLFSVTIPLMGRFIFFQFLGSLIGSLQVGEAVIQLSPNGGFNGNLNFFGLLIYNQTQASSGLNFGVASALSYILFAIIGLLSIITFRENKKIYYED